MFREGQKINCRKRYNKGMKLKEKYFCEILGILHRSDLFEDESEESIFSVLDKAESEEEEREMKLTHSFHSMALVGEDYIKKARRAQATLKEIEERLIAVLVLLDRLYNKGLIEPEDLYEFRNYIYEGLQRFMSSSIDDLCQVEEDINKILWGLEKAQEEMTALLKNEY